MSSLTEHKTPVSGVKVPYSHCILDTFCHFFATDNAKPMSIFRLFKRLLQFVHSDSYQIQIIRVAVILTVNRLQKLSGFCCCSSRDFWSNGFIVATCEQDYCSSDKLPPTALFLTPADPLQPGCVSLKLVAAGEGRWLKWWAFVFALSCCPSLVFPPRPFAAGCSASRQTVTRSVPDSRHSSFAVPLWQLQNAVWLEYVEAQTFKIKCSWLSPRGCMEVKPRIYLTA